MNDIKSIVCIHDPLDAEAILWRYMDFPKFVSILENQALFFVRADRLNDPFEGSLPTRNIESQQTNLHPEFKEAMTMAGLPTYSLYWKQLPRFTLVNCWHHSDYESEAMWKLYSTIQGGIAIKTRFHIFIESFIAYERIHIGMVNYVDYDSQYIPQHDPLSPYLYKRNSFAHEREVRAIIQDLPIRNIGQFQGIYDIGNYCKVDLNLLIQEVVIDPFAPDWFLNLVTAVAKRYSLHAPITKSPLAKSPSW